MIQSCTCLCVTICVICYVKEKLRDIEMQALEKKKFFLLDYHDLLIPLVNKVREIEGTTLYGSRTLFFLTESGCLRPIAIELTRPPTGDKPQWKQVFIPCWDATGIWLWRLAKAHVCAHDSGYHQLVIHWLRTHCVTEPYIIAANRQMSAIHPIYRLLNPHFRYTMEINALARESLINAGGVIESSFSPGKYSMELSSAAYDKLWRFDMEALPADLIRRGMAVEDPTAKQHGLKLTIEDYPFANDGLILWDAIKKWVSDYVNHYYQDASVVECDEELQGWWTEVRTKGHEDKKDEPWWPVLKTQKDLVHVLTTIIWVTSGHHAAVNFGQYTYAGYFPNRPTIARTNMPCEDPSDEAVDTFMTKPETVLLNCFPSKIQATTVMAVLDVLSTHSPDEEYIGEILEPSWTENPVIMDAFECFKDSLKELERIINERNADKSLRNRVGAGVVPYELLKPFSKPGVTGMGVPNSISI
uniref:linoleate 13S-lipoxygenase 2-1, chloroplastic-like n=1 Tax=Fragaria vesca subsp. vesca TaxID=101020 RepID=UPI0005C910F4|nr:PREDICTED: linoleate 13S-lipoxygenase 2-1, chloroplastic-like [Fragaria vesca subsp. vesca]